MDKPGSRVALLVLSGLLAGIGALQLLSVEDAVQPVMAALAAVVAFGPAGYFLGLYAGRPKVQDVKPVEPALAPDGDSVVVPFKRRQR
jgi:membrane protein DedA with SNARE-associated domain